MATTDKHRGGDAPDGKPNKVIWSVGGPDRHRGWDALDGKTNKHLYGWWVGQTDTEGGRHRMERLTSDFQLGGGLGWWVVPAA